MKKICILILILCLTATAVTVFAQCSIEAGKDTSIVCGESIQISAETNWQALSSGVSKNLASAYFTDADTGYIVGDSGIVLKTINGGANFTIQTSGTAEHLYTVYFTNNDTGYILGNNGVILKTTNGGVTWGAQVSGTTWGLHAIFFTGTDTGYVGGDGGLILKTTDGGLNWTPEVTNVNTMFRSFYFTNPDTGYAVGYSGGILKTTNGGATWVTKYALPNVNFNSVWFTSADTGYVTGIAGNGFILKTVDGGNSWTIQFSENVSLSSIFFTTKTTGYAIGHNNSIPGEILLKTTNGGSGWEMLQLSTSGYVRSVFYPDAGNGYIVGDNGAILKSAAMNTYTWTPALGLSATNIPNPAARPVVTTTYTVTAESDSCIVTDSITIYVNPLIAKAGSDRIVNSGDSVQLNVSTNGTGIQDLSYKWQPPAGLSSDSVSNPFARINTNTNYIITVSTDGCEAIDTINVSLSIHLNAGKDKKVLCSKSVQLNAESAWIKLISGAASALESVYFISADTGYVAGGKDMYKTIDGGISWTKKTLNPNISSTRAIYFTSSSIGYAIGRSDLQMDGAISKTTDGGNSWTTQTFSTSIGLNAVSFPSASIGYAVGSPGKIYKTSNGGNSWVAQTSGTTNFLNAVYFVNTAVGYAFGNAIILKTTDGGSHWTSQASLTTDEITSVNFISADTGYFVTAHGELWKSTDGGDNWAIQTNRIDINATPTFNQTFLSVAFTDVNTGYAVSKYMNMPQPEQFGAIFKTVNGGVIWERQPADSGNYLCAVCFANSKIGYAVGDNGTVLKLPLPPDSYSWSPAVGLSATNISTPVATPVITTTYAVKGITNGCSVTDSVTVFVDPLTVNAGRDREVVCGDSARLIVNNVFVDISASRNGSSWMIKDSDDKVWLSSVPDKDTMGYINLPDGQYTFICKPTVVPPALRIRIMPFAQDSISDEILFTTDTVITRTFDVITESKYSYSWSPPGNLVGPAAVTTAYQLRVSSPEGCTAVDSINIIPVPIKVNGGADKTIVCGATAYFDTLTSNYTGPGDLSYKWLPATGLSNDTIMNPSSKVNTGTVYSLSVSNAIGCTAADTIEVIVNALTIAGADLNIRCGDTARLITSTNYTGTDSLTYLWSPALGLDSVNIPYPVATVYTKGSYTVKITTPNGCVAIDSMQVSPSPFNAIDICIAGVDDFNKNLIVWNKPSSTAIDSFFLYRETNITDIYMRAGAVGYSSFSTFSDTNSFPDIQANKYKISIRDKCGLESAPGAPHKTMHLSINKGIGNTWNLIWGAYEGFTVATYNVYRGSTPDDLVLIGTSSGSNTQYSDINAPSGDVYYQVEVVSPNSCNPSKSYNTSRSNISTNKASGLNENMYPKVLFSLYPNPSSAMITLTVNINVTDGYTLNIYNMAGTLVRTEKFFQAQQVVNLDFLNNGIYIAEVQSKGYSGKQKLVIQR